MLQFPNFAGRRHQRCLLKRGTFGTSRWQLYDEIPVFLCAREEGDVSLWPRPCENGSSLPSARVSAAGESGHSIRSPTAGHPPKLAVAGCPVALPPGVRSRAGALGRCCLQLALRPPGRTLVGRSWRGLGRRPATGRGGARNRLLAHLLSPSHQLCLRATVGSAYPGRGCMGTGSTGHQRGWRRR
jgi:hypothetical protein